MANCNVEFQIIFGLHLLRFLVIAALSFHVQRILHENVDLKNVK